MHISYKPLWHTLLERDMRKEDLRLAAGMTTNMIANMSKEGKHISMDTLARIFPHLEPRFEGNRITLSTCLPTMRKNP